MESNLLSYNTNNQPYLNQSEDFWDLNSELDLEIEVNKQFASENRPFNLKSYHQLFLSKINLENFKSQKEILDKIYQDVSTIYAVLKKLERMELSFSFDITGGATRDFVNGKPIKDLDIMLSIFNTYENKTILSKLNDIGFLKKYFSVEAIVFCIKDAIEAIDDESSFIAQKQQLLSLCFHDVISEKFTFTSSNRKEEMSKQDIYNENMWKQNRLLGVFKLSPEKMKLNYPVDILLTDFHKIEFIKDFDLDICKASFSLVNSVYKTSFPKDSLELISRFTAETSFWADIHSKKMTLNVDNMSNKTIENSIKKHFKRLKEKYPDYSLNIISSKEFEANYKFAQSIYLNENF